MSIKTKILALILLSFASISQLGAQNYMIAFGPRVGMSNGVSLKVITKSPNVIESIIHMSHGGTRITGMYQYLRPFNGRTYSSGLHWFVGVGGHFANYSNFEYTNFDGKIVRQAYQGFGFDMTAGIEYMFSAPLSFSIDLKPYYEVQTLEIAPSHFIDIALSVRHTFF
jgi:hypothetical protein